MLSELCQLSVAGCQLIGPDLSALELMPGEDVPFCQLPTDN